MKLRHYIYSPDLGLERLGHWRAAGDAVLGRRESRPLRSNRKPSQDPAEKHIIEDVDQPVPVDVPSAIRD